MNAVGSTGLLEWGPRAAPAAVATPVEYTPLRMGVTPIAQHNREMAEHGESWFAPDPGKYPVVFRYVYPVPKNDNTPAIPGMYLVIKSTLEPRFKPRAGFLNYDGKCEILPNPAAPREHLVFVRRDLTEAEFEAIPVLPSASSALPEER